MTKTEENQLTMADVRKKLRENNPYTEYKWRRVDNALNSIWRYSGIPLENIPATMAALSEVINKIEPAAHGVGRPTIINVRNYAMHALKQTGAVPELDGYRERRKPLAPEWQVLFQRITTLNRKTSLWSFLHYLNEKGVKPGDVGDAHLQRFRDYLTLTSPRPSQHLLIRQVAINWNKIRVEVPEMELQAFAIPPSRLRRLPYALVDFPQPFQGSVSDYKRWLLQEDVFDDDAKDRKVTRSTAENYVRRIHRCASHLAVAGVPLRDFSNLKVLLDVENFKTILRSLMATDGSAQQAEAFHSATVLLQVARRLKCSPEHVETLTKLTNKMPKPKLMMTDKNKKLVSQFDDPAVLQRLLNAPRIIWEKLAKDKRMGGRTRLAQAQAALGLAILTMMPLRLGNLTNLTFGEHLVLHAGGKSSLIIPAEDTKAGHPLEFDIPEPLATMLLEFYQEIAPSVIGTHPQNLFCRTDGGAKGFSQVRYLVQRYFKEYVGFHMNPHAFSHLCAKIILDAEPGAHTLVQELLGHKSVETSTAFYAGLNSRRAGRHHHTLITERLSKQAPVAFNRRRKAGK